MAVFAEPKKWGVVPGNAADISEIQEEGSSLYPSLTDFFPAIYQLALSAGGKAPERATFNALFKMIMERLYFIERGGVWSYDATADYPAGAVVGYSGSVYLALKDNGEGTDAGAVQPDADGAVWQKLPTLADVAKAFLLISDAEADYLKKSDASDTYLSKDDASDTYLSKDDASDTYLSKNDAADTYQTKEDLSSQIITSVRSNWYATYPDGAEAHNAMWGGRDITAAFDSGEFSEHVADGSFTDIFPGDYITKQVTIPQILKADGTTEYIAQTTYTVKFIIADLDIWLNRGDTAPAAHHVAIVPQSAVFNSVMNESNVTTGGYVGSFMNTNVMPAFATGLQGAFGASHLISFRYLDTVSVNNSLAALGVSGWTGAAIWGSQMQTYTCHLLNETMVYGAPIFASSAPDEHMGGVQMAAFRLNSNLVYNRQNYWLSDVVSSAAFALVDGDGFASTSGASGVYGVRPFALLV